MKEKPDVLSNEKLQEAYTSIRNEVMAKICQAKSIKSMPIDIVDQIVNETIKVGHCEDLIQQAKAEVAREIFGEIGKINQPDPPAGTFMESPNMAWTNGYWACYEKVKSLKSKFLKEKKGN